MSVLEFSAREADPFDSLIALDQSALDVIPAAVYVCAADGTILRFQPSSGGFVGTHAACGRHR